MAAEDYKPKHLTLDEIDAFKAGHSEIYEDVDPIIENKRKERANKRVVSLSDKLKKSMDSALN